MKRIIIVLGLIGCIATSCKKETEAEPQKTANQPSNTNAVHGDWKLAIYDGVAISSPMEGTYKATANSATGGTVHFDITFDGTAHQTEDATYVLSNNDKNIVFTKTGGSFNVLSGGGTWTINEMTASTIDMKSSMGLHLKMTK